MAKTCGNRSQAATLRLILLLLLLAVCGHTQASQSGGKHKTAGESPATTQSTTQQPPKPPAQPATEEQKISPQEAEKLFRSVDEILQFASKDTLFPIKREAKRHLVSRAELVLKKFGLLPRDFDLGTFLVALLKEQIAGYYDPKTRAVNLLDWLGADQQKPVLAHELTHALQDQSFNLEKYMKPADTDLAKKKEVTAQDIENDEISTTRQAVVEGQAMVVLVDYLLE